MPKSSDELVDPDPFSVGLGLVQIFAAGVMFLEARRHSQATQQGQRDQFLAVYFQAKRSLIFFKRAVDEFETYIFEGGYGRKEFRIGAVRIMFEPRQRQAMRRLHGQILTTANHMADNLDDISEHLGPEDQKNVDAIHARAKGIEAFPDSYRDVIALSREAVQLYQDLLDDVGERENFDTDNSA